MNYHVFLLLGLICLFPGQARGDDDGIPILTPDATGAVTETVPAEPASRIDPYILEPSHVGALELGSSVNEVISLFGESRLRHVERIEEGASTPALEVYSTPAKTGKPQVIFGLEEGDTLAGAEIDSPLYHTPQGLAVGSTMKDVRFAFKSISPKQVSLDDDGTLSVNFDDLSMSFILDPNTMSEAALDRYEINRDPSMIPDSVPIIKILLY